MPIRKMAVFKFGWDSTSRWNRAATFTPIVSQSSLPPEMPAFSTAIRWGTSRSARKSGQQVSASRCRVFISDRIPDDDDGTFIGGIDQNVAQNQAGICGGSRGEVFGLGQISVAEPCRLVAKVRPNAICVSIITAVELRYDCAKKRSTKLPMQIEATLAEVLALDVPTDA